MPFFDVLFEIEVTLCKQFPALTPISLRKEKAVEVFKLMNRFIKYNKNEEKRARDSELVPAGDNWF